MISPQEVDNLVTLARIKVSADEKEILRKDLEGILSYVSQVKEVEEKTDNNLSSIQLGDLINVMRADGTPHESGIFSYDILAEAPCCIDNQICVKKIL